MDNGGRVQISGTTHRVYSITFESMNGKWANFATNSHYLRGAFLVLYISICMGSSNWLRPKGDQPVLDLMTK